MRIAVWSTLVFGAWLIISPFSIPYESRAATAEDIIAGALIIAFSLVAVVGRGRFPRAAWILVALGVWVAIAPFVLGYYRNITTSDPVANDIVVGSIVFLLALIRAVSLRVERRVPE